MIDALFKKINSISGKDQLFEIHIRLGKQILIKKNDDWIELPGHELILSEWEDLKDSCLHGHEKIVLETKGFVRGVYEQSTEKISWKFSFIEGQNETRAYFQKNISFNENSLSLGPIFWNTIKESKGLFLIAGEKNQGKSFLLNEIIRNQNQDLIKIVGVHSFNIEFDSSAVNLGVETLHQPVDNPIYDGLERIIVDTNSISNWSKWIGLSEQGCAVLATLNTDSILAVLDICSGGMDSSEWRRFLRQLKGIVVQKKVPGFNAFVNELAIFKEQEKSKLLLLKEEGVNESFLSSLSHYQDFNQSIMQALIKRKIDVKMAFSISPNPEKLDLMMKKMGL